MHNLNAESQKVLTQVVATSLVKKMVLAIARTDEPGFHITVDEAGEEQGSPSSLYDLVKYIPQFEVTFSYPRDEYFDVFWQACQDVGVEWWPVFHSLNSTETRCISTPQTVNALVDRIRQLSREPAGLG